MLNAFLLAKMLMYGHTVEMPANIVEMYDCMRCQPIYKERLQCCLYTQLACTYFQVVEVMATDELSCSISTKAHVCSTPITSKLGSIMLHTSADLQPYVCVLQLQSGTRSAADLSRF